MEREEFIKEFNKIKKIKKYVSQDEVLQIYNKSIDSYYI